MKTTSRTFQTGMTAFVAVSFTVAGEAGAAEAGDPKPKFSDTEIQFVYGSKYREPFNPTPDNDTDVTRYIVTLQHASAHKYGRNFFFVDFLNSQEGEPAGRDDFEVYGEWYTSLSLSSVTGRNLKFGPLKDINLTAGLNAGAKSNGANPRVVLYGVTLDFDVPGFIFFNVDFLRYDDHGHFAGLDQDLCASWQVTPAWLSKFNIGPTKWVFTGHVDWIKDRCGADGLAGSSDEILAQPELKLDVGDFFGKPDTVYAGIEYQYWKNKFGFKGLDENNPQLIISWKF